MIITLAYMALLAFGLIMNGIIVIGLVTLEITRRSSRRAGLYCLAGTAALALAAILMAVRGGLH